MNRTYSLMKALEIAKANAMSCGSRQYVIIGKEGCASEYSIQYIVHPDTDQIQWTAGGTVGGVISHENLKERAVMFQDTGYRVQGSLR